MVEALSGRLGLPVGNAAQDDGSRFCRVWYPCPDSNRGTRFRKPVLYPPELQGHDIDTTRGRNLDFSSVGHMFPVAEGLARGLSMTRHDAMEEVSITLTLTLSHQGRGDCCLVDEPVCG